MSERDDYLFDPSSPADPDVQALERALAPLRRAPGPAPERVLAAAAPRRPVRLLAAAAAAAAAALWLLIAWWSSSPAGLAPGAPARAFVAGQEPLVVRLGELAAVTLQPGSALDFVHWRGDEARVRLRRGALVAEVAPPPAVAAGWFVCELPGGEVVDQGCRFELSVSDVGGGRVRVTEGAVTFGGEQRAVFVPAGASARQTQAGASTPTFLDAPPDLKKLVAIYDGMGRTKDPGARVGVARKLAFSCALPRDTLVLWHLLSDPEPEVFKLANEVLFDIVGAPDGASPPLRTYSAAEWLPHLRVAAWGLGR